MNTSFISIIIPAKNAQATIAKCITSLRSLNYAEKEIIIINDGSGDETGKILSEFKDIIVINTEGVGPSRCRNLAMAQSKGEFIAFTDSDCIADKEWLNELLKGFVDDSIVGVGGAQESPDDDTKFGKNVHEFFKSIGFIEYIKLDVGFKQIKHNPTCNMMYRKKVLEELGGFLEGFWPGEDVELDYRITQKGYKLAYNPRAIVYHYRPDSVKKLCKMMYKYGWAQGVLVRKYGLFRKIQILPLLLSAWVLLLLLIFSRYVLSGFSFLVFSYVIILAYLSFQTKSYKKAFTFSLFSLLSLVYWNIGYVVRLLNKKNIR